MRTPLTLAAKMVAIGSTFLVLALLCVGSTLWVAWQLEGGAAAVNEAGRMRMQSYRLALEVREARPEVVQHYITGLDASLALLRQGDPSRPLFVPWDTRVDAAFDAVSSRWQALRGRWSGVIEVTPAQARDEADEMSDDVDRFVSAIETHLATWTSIMQLLQTGMLMLAVAAAAVLLYVAYIIVLEPVHRLEQGLQRLEGGDFATRVEVYTRDEFGRVAEGFNRMAGRLEEVYRHLEDKVREKTASLEREQERLACLYDVTSHITDAGTLDELAQGFARRIARVARADASAIRWADPDEQRFVLLASHCLPEAIAQAEQCVRQGDCHCGAAAGATHARVIPIRSGVGGVHAPLCEREGFGTVVTVPVRQHDRIIGEVELFHRGEVQLQEHERSLIEALVSHLASAIESLRATALEREQAVSQERMLLAQELHDSIAQSLAFLKIQVQLLRAAMSSGDEAAIREALTEIDNGVKESSGDVRELLIHFRTRASGEQIEPALRTTLSKFEHQTGVPSTLRVSGHGLPIPPDIQVQVLHVLQEALSNVRKHAGANHVTLEVTKAPAWRFAVIDDGVGFSPDGAAPDETHVGLRIMRERAQRIGATLQVFSRPGGGTRVELALPAHVSAAPVVAQGPGSDGAGDDVRAAQGASGLGQHRQSAGEPARTA